LPTTTAGGIKARTIDGHPPFLYHSSVNKPISVLYAGSPDFSARVLRVLIESQGGSFCVAGVLTNPPAAKGRGENPPQPTPVAALALKAQVPVFTPERLDAKARHDIAALGCDLLVCFSYGRIFGPKFLALFSMGGINVHPSLLPKYRGAVPVPQAILKGDSETGVTVQKIALKMDSGDILLQKIIALNGSETSESLLERLSDEGANLVLNVLQTAAASGELPRGKPQDESAASYCVKLQKEDGRIDWNQSALVIDAKIRAFVPWPGAFTFNRGERVNIKKAVVAHNEAPPCPRDEFDSLPAGAVLGSNESGILVKTGDGILAIQKIQRQAKNALDWKAFLAGNKSFFNARLGEKSTSSP
jgi:methionyl-tRNA formyltransferase